MSNTSRIDTAPAQVQPSSQSLDHAVQDLRHQVTPFLDRASDQVGAIARHGIDSLRDTSHQLKLKAERASDNTVSYIRHEPVKSVLIAAATGAALMVLVNLLTRSRTHH